MGKVRVLVDSPMIQIDEGFYQVKPYRPGKKLKDNIAYTIDGRDIVYLYRGKLKSDSYLPGIYIKKGQIHIIEPDIEDIEKYDIDNINEFSSDRIFDEILNNSDEFVLPEDVEIINNNSDIFVPVIKEEDDFLKVAVKQMILDKQVNLKNYKDKFSNHYLLTNMKSALSKSTKMTVPNFNTWCDVFGVDWELRLYDNGTDRIRPLEEDIVIRSEDFK